MDNGILLWCLPCPTLALISNTRGNQDRIINVVFLQGYGLWRKYFFLNWKIPPKSIQRRNLRHFSHSGLPWSTPAWWSGGRPVPKEATAVFGHLCTEFDTFFALVTGLKLWPSFPCIEIHICRFDFEYWVENRRKSWILSISGGPKNTHPIWNSYFNLFSASYANKNYSNR